MIRVCQTGRNPTMRHLGRTHRVSVAWLHERFAELGIDLRFEMTHRQAADYTKVFHELLKWIAACLLINMVDGKHLETLFQCFASHNAEQLEQDYDLLFQGLHTKSKPKSDYMDYTASCSVQRRGASQTSPTSWVEPKTMKTLKSMLNMTFLTSMLTFTPTCR